MGTKFSIKKTSNPKGRAMARKRRVRISMRKIEIYDRRGPRSYSMLVDWFDGRGHDFSSMEETYRMLKAVDPNFEGTLEMHKEAYLR